ncbi:hypothetical protein ULMS_13860 [Patiriisocius marinistellae]|uniref:YetF C-terminal domain-containing protein n=2 Tax=Patiriisocius marinistellae TaxID=2494560 RepID=A0A5J4FX34_9FLAO|nr:hypothetical protein ULMS_13860 [Patiriisocius marinistellae]
MSSFDFASTIAVGSILAAVVMNTDQSILKGGIALVAVIGYQTIFSFAKRKFEWFDALFTNKPMLLMKDGEFLKDNMKKTNVSLEDLYAKLREANVRDTSEVLAMVMESTGDISVIHTDVKDNLASEILTGVRKD